MLLGQLKPKDFDFLGIFTTRWNDMDALGHVNHTAFLSYMETARVDTYIQLGFEGINKEWTRARYWQHRDNLFSSIRPPFIFKNWP
ncbi:MAG: hypothetical protein CM15mP44_5210 [Candidatus Neomarinimicrobiota bacterium]|nr:MAG: hypothetical protein CM15mP44_5210 [Candidatus Neomarinimicrobiota bacterium]